MKGPGGNNSKLTREQMIDRLNAAIENANRQHSEEELAAAVRHLEAYVAEQRQNASAQGELQLPKGGQS